MNRVLAKGDRVRVADNFFWARGATGTIGDWPNEVKMISGDLSDDLTRQENSALGIHTVYWVRFDKTQTDADGDGPYRARQIWQEALSLFLTN